MHDGQPPSPTSHGHDQPPADARAERRQRRVIGSGDTNPRLAAAQYVARHRLEPFYRALGGLAIAVFGPEATVVPHLRRDGRSKRLVFVVDAASPEATVDYASFLPLEQAFWTAYAHVPKPDLPLGVAIRPARGWCRTEALAPFFVHLPTPGDAT
jgi:hypothetical protein